MVGRWNFLFKKVYFQWFWRLVSGRVQYTFKGTWKIIPFSKCWITMVIVSPLPNGLNGLQMEVSTRILPLGLASKAWKAELRDWKLKSIDTWGSQFWFSKLLFWVFLIGGLPLPTCFTSWGCLFLNVFCCCFFNCWFHRGFCCKCWSREVVKLDILNIMHSKKNLRRDAIRKKQKKSSRAPNISSWGCKDRGFCMISQTGIGRCG